MCSFSVSNSQRWYVPNNVISELFHLLGDVNLCAVISSASPCSKELC